MLEDVPRSMERRMVEVGERATRPAVLGDMDEPMVPIEVDERARVCPGVQPCLPKLGERQIT